MRVRFWRVLASAAPIFPALLANAPVAYPSGREHLAAFVADDAAVLTTNDP